MTHELKIDKPYFEQILSGQKKFEVRINDRGFQAGDYVLLECNGIDYVNKIKFQISYIHSGFAMEYNHVILGFDKHEIIRG